MTQRIVFEMNSGKIYFSDFIDVPTTRTIESSEKELKDEIIQNWKKLNYLEIVIEGRSRFINPNLIEEIHLEFKDVI